MDTKNTTYANVNIMFKDGTSKFALIEGDGTPEDMAKAITKQMRQDVAAFAGVTVVEVTEADYNNMINGKPLT